MIGIGLGAVVTAFIGLGMAAIIESITNSCISKIKGEFLAWTLVFIVSTILAAINFIIGIFCYVGMFWAYIILRN